MWQRIKCLFGRHDLRLGVNYAPDLTCMTVFCACCSAKLFHFDMVDDEEGEPPPKPTTKTGRLH